MFPWKKLLVLFSMNALIHSGAEGAKFSSTLWIPGHIHKGTFFFLRFGSLPCDLTLCQNWSQMAWIHPAPA